MPRKKKGNRNPPPARSRAKSPPPAPGPTTIRGRDAAGGSRNRLAIGGVLALAFGLVAAGVYWGVTQKSVAPPAPRTVALARYVGGAECSTCHAEEHAAWKGSDHDLAMQVADDQSVLGNFANAKFAYAGTTSTFFRRDGRFMVNTDGADGKLADYEIKYAFGVHPLQQYLIEIPGGRIQALGIAWDSRPAAAGGQRWFHLYPGQNIKAGDPLHWTGANQNWNFQCAECHSTNLRKGYDPKTETFHTTWSEIDVACEACHGPGSNHVAWAKKASGWEALATDKGLAVALDERRGVAWTPVAETGNARRSRVRETSREVDTCARCHARASRISDDYVHGQSPLESHRPALLDENLYWSDGQMRDEVYNWGSFVQSHMYAAGVTCSDCHDPHSLKLRSPGNGVCAQCHQPARFDNMAHTHHAAGTRGAACAACHMPTTTYMIVDPRHDHSMRIPRPDVSAKVGSPNACNNCHTRQTAQWAADAIHAWTGKPPASFQNFAEALQAGSSGAPGARGALLTLIADKTQPAVVRASAIERLGHWLTPTVTDVVSRSLNDPDPLVRLAAVEALASADAATQRRYLSRMLDDPVRAVRAEAARAFAGAGEQGLSAQERTSFDRALADYVGIQTYNADRPEGRVSLGNLHAQRGNAAAAMIEYRKAIAIDPAFVPAYANLADLYRARGEEAEAEAALKEGMARNPGAAVLHHAYGLALTRRKQSAEALTEFRQAMQLAPQNARFAYVYAVALNDAGRTGDSIRVITAALKAAPYDRDLLSGLAYFTAQTGHREQALGYVKQLQALDPENAEYRDMAKEMGGTAGMSQGR